jgi:hypothetical protein
MIFKVMGTINMFKKLKLELANLRAINTMVKSYQMSLRFELRQSIYWVAVSLMLFRLN